MPDATLREVLAASIDKVEKEEEVLDDPSLVTELPEVPKTEEPEKKPPEPEAPKTGELPKEPGEAKPPVAPAAPAAPTPPVSSPAPSPEGTDKAPGTWTPVAREKWATVDPEIKKEIWKREREASRAFTISEDARRLQAEFERTLQPYMGFIAAEKSTPLQAVNNMMQTAAALRVGTPQQKVSIVAGIIQNFGIDLNALDSVLAGQKPEFNPMQQIEALVNQRVAPIQQQLQEYQQLSRRQVDTQVTSELDSFINATDEKGKPKHEFYADVSEIMADLMEIDHRRGGNMDLTQAYDRAILMSEPVRRVIEGRKQTEAANRANEKARQARGAAISVVPSAEVSIQEPAPGDSVRSAIEFAIAKTEAR